MSSNFLSLLRRFLALIRHRFCYYALTFFSNCFVVFCLDYVIFSAIMSSHFSVTAFFFSTSLFLLLCALRKQDVQLYFVVLDWLIKGKFF